MQGLGVLKFSYVKEDDLVETLKVPHSGFLQGAAGGCRDRRGLGASPTSTPPPSHHLRQNSTKTQRGKNTYNTRDSLVVTDLTTDLALTSLFRGERTGSQAFW